MRPAIPASNHKSPAPGTAEPAGGRRQRPRAAEEDEAEKEERWRAFEAASTLRDSDAIKPVTREEILAWRDEGHKYWGVRRPAGGGTWAWWKGIPFTVEIGAAEARLSGPVARADAGEEIVIARGGQRVARLRTLDLTWPARVRQTIDAVRALRARGKPVTVEEILAWKRKGHLEWGGSSISSA